MKDLLLGAHTSAAGGAPQALYEGKEIGANTVQIFTSNQKQWHGRIISDDELALWDRVLDETEISHVMSHASYLINLGSADSEIQQKSRLAFRSELERCHALKLSYLNIHPGAAVRQTADKCIETIIESLREVEELAAKGSTRILLETTAGQGTCVGHRFEQLAAIIEPLHRIIPIGVCIDTCHIFVAGYDVRTEEDWNSVLKDFDEVIGLKHLFAFHLNDSMKQLGSRVDRHAPLGEGEIGLKSFEVLMRHPKTRLIPKYLETPGGPPQWKKEIALLRSY